MYYVTVIAAGAGRVGESHNYANGQCVVLSTALLTFNKPYLPITSINKYLKSNASSTRYKPLITLPLQKYAHVLNKDEFRYSICLRYSWWIPKIPITLSLYIILFKEVKLCVFSRHNCPKDTIASISSVFCDF